METPYVFVGELAQGLVNHGKRVMVQYNMAKEPGGIHCIPERQLPVRV